MDKIAHGRSIYDSADQPSSTSLRVLFLEDNPHDVEFCLRELDKAGFEIQADTVDTEEAFAARLQSCVYDLILSDFRIPGWSGVKAFHLLKQTGKDIPFILVTGTLGEEAAVELIKEGVADYILKDRLVRLPSAVRRALEEKTTRNERERADQSLRESEGRVRLLLESTAEAIYGIDAQGNCTFCNAASLRLLGYEKPSDLLGKQMHWLIHHTRIDGTPYPLEECKIYKAFREGKGSHAEDEVLWRKDGYSFPAEYWAYPVIEEGKLVGSVVTFLDITERKRAGTTIRKERDRAQQYLDIADVILLAVDLKGRITLINRKGCSALGWSEHELLGRNWIDTCIPASIRDELKASFDTLIGGQLAHMENAVLTKSGEERLIAWRNTLLRDGAGRIIGTLSSGEDITDRKRAERELQRSEERVRRLVESNIIGIAIGDLDGKLIDANDAFLGLLGYTKRDLLSGEIRWDSVTPPEYRESDRRAREELRTMGVASPWEKQFFHRDGGRISVLIGVTTLVAANGDIECISFVVDISERKKVEENLERVVAVVESSPDAIIHETLDGMILTWNLGAEQIYGYSPAEVLGKSLSITAPADRKAEFQEILEKVTRGQKVEQLETIRLRKDGRPVPVSLTVSPIKDTHGQIVSASVIARDITETKRMEEMFRQAQKMEAVGRLAGGVAHDFNNLLGVIIGYGEIVEERLNPDDPLRAKVEQIKKAGQRAAGLTRQLLAFSRQQILEPKILSLNSVVADIQKMLQRLIGEDIELITTLATNLASVKADQGQIEQVIMNLAVNARDAMPYGGTLTIETAHVELDELDALNHSELSAGSFVMLRVTDTGTGMDSEIQKHIFEPFFTTKEQGKGTGLGLATVYGVVKQSGGSISVASELGRGTSFTIYVPPVHAPIDVEQQSVGSKDMFVGTETILLVEDEESLRQLTRDVLLESHYTVLEASDGLEALGIAQQHRGPIHLLLTDVVMPRMGGPALATQLALEHPEMKVLYMSGYTGGSTSLQALGNSRSQFLQKPFTRSDLSSKLREVLGVFKEQAILGHGGGIE